MDARLRSCYGGKSTMRSFRSSRPIRRYCHVTLHTSHYLKVGVVFFLLLYWPSGWNPDCVCSIFTAAVLWSVPTGLIWSLGWASFNTCCSISSHTISWSYRTASTGHTSPTHSLVRHVSRQIFKAAFSQSWKTGEYRGISNVKYVLNISKYNIYIYKL